MQALDPGLSVKVAVTVVSALVVGAQVPAPVQPPPDQPANVDPEPGVAVNETAAPNLNACEQVPGHEIPLGVLTTEPEPEPTRDTVNVTVAAPKPTTSTGAELLVRFPSPSWPSRCTPSTSRRPPVVRAHSM